MTKIAAITAPTMTLQAAGKAAAPVAAELVAEAVKAIESPKILAQVQPIAAALLGVLIEAQAKAHTNPQPDHGEDNEHGHKPPLVTPPPPVVTPPPAPPPVVAPPVVTPPVAPPPIVSPPVVAPPVVEPPVVRPPAVHLQIASDPTAAARAAAMLDRQLAEVALSTLARNTFLTVAAASRSAAYVGQAGAAISVLGALEAGMQTFNASWSARSLRA